MQGRYGLRCAACWGRPLRPQPGLLAGLDLVLESCFPNELAVRFHIAGISDHAIKGDAPSSWDFSQVDQFSQSRAHSRPVRETKAVVPEGGPQLSIASRPAALSRNPESAGRQRLFQRRGEWTMGR